MNKSPKRVFVAYADAKMSYSLMRIGRQARALDIFDEVILYTPDDLPDKIRQLKLMQFSYGGGYWAWKPWIIYDTLQKNEEGTIVCYVDAGCTLRKGIEWSLYFDLMNDYQTLCFKYKDFMPEWGKFGTSCTKIKYWSKKSLLLFLDKYTNNDSYRETNKIWGGALFFKGKNNPFLSQWMDITFNYPEVILDPSEEELSDQYPFFVLHKHDQVVLTALASYNMESCMILPELSETHGECVAIYASRIRAKSKYEYILEMAKRKMRKLLGPIVYDLFKKSLKKL